MSDIGQTYHAFWATLLPQSNRWTGFSLRSPTRRSYVEFCHVGFCFHYQCWLHMISAERIDSLPLQLPGLLTTDNPIK